MNELTTPRPWRVEKYRGRRRLIGPDGVIAAETSRFSDNDDLIVRAVNHHDTLVSAVRKAREQLRRSRNYSGLSTHRERLTLAAENTLILALEELDGKASETKE